MCLFIARGYFRDAVLSVYRIDMVTLSLGPPLPPPSRSSLTSLINWKTSQP
jgi:hypothetical protein